MTGTPIATMVDFTGGALNAAILHETPIFTFSKEYVCLFCPVAAYRTRLISPFAWS